MGLLAWTWLPPNGPAAATAGLDNSVGRWRIRALRNKKSNNMKRLSIIFQIQPHSSLFVSLHYLYDVLCVQDKKGWMLIVLMGIAAHLTSLYCSCSIIGGCSSQVPHHVPVTEFVSLFIPAAEEECHSSPLGLLVLTVKASQWRLRDNQIIKDLFSSSELSRSLSTRCQVWVHYSTCDISDELRIFVPVSPCHLMSLLLLFNSPLPSFRYVFTQPFKGQWF